MRAVVAAKRWKFTSRKFSISVIWDELRCCYLTSIVFIPFIFTSYQILYFNDDIFFINTNPIYFTLKLY